MRIVNNEWIELTEKYCEHYGVSTEHFGEMKCLRKDAPDHIKKIYAETMKLWQQKGYELPEDAGEYL